MQYLACEVSAVRGGGAKQSKGRFSLDECLRAKRLFFFCLMSFRLEPMIDLLNFNNEKSICATKFTWWKTGLTRLSNLPRMHVDVHVFNVALTVTESISATLDALPKMLY